MKIIDALICAAQEGKCFYCAEEFNGSSHGKMKRQRWTRDHLRPKSKGHDGRGNIVLACGPCNSGKSDRAPTENELLRAERIHALVEKLGSALIGSCWRWDVSNG